MEIKSKMPLLPKEFYDDDLICDIEIKEEKNENLIDEEEDELDKFMREIQKEAAVKDYQIVQHLANQNLQKQYDYYAIGRNTNGNIH